MMQKNLLMQDVPDILRLTKKVEIVCGDYKESADLIDKHTFVYFEPPYSPLAEMSNFTAYTEFLFTDEEQIELVEFVDEMNKKVQR